MTARDLLIFCAAYVHLRQQTRRASVRLRVSGLCGPRAAMWAVGHEAAEQSAPDWTRNAGTSTMTLHAHSQSSIGVHRILSMREICELTGYSRTHIYRLERAGKFIRRRKLGPAKIGFLLSEYQEWVSRLPLPDLPEEGEDA